MNLSLYNPPEKWTEDLILQISDEDNRFEFKEWKTDKKEFELMLAKEICALANSFGGTLFLGIKDGTKEIVGVPKIAKGRSSAKAWLESIIPNLLEFRLPNFRVLEVDLNPVTKAKFNDLQVIISIDVYDSDLAPHRSTKDQVYYFRQSSKSDPAPHHYLAFLWGRTSPNMSNVVNTWFKVYVNYFIYLLEEVAKNFRENKFNTTDDPVGRIPLYIRKILFFDINGWNKLNTGLTAKQFLRIFPNIELKLNEFDNLISNFFQQLTELEEIIGNSQELEGQMRKLYSDIMYREGFKDTQQFDEKPFEEILRLYAYQVFESELKSLGDTPQEFKKILVRYTFYDLLNLESSLSLNGSIFFNLCKEHISNQLDESKEEIEVILQQIIETRNEISQIASLLAKEVDELRYALALKYNTTFE